MATRVRELGNGRSVCLVHGTDLVDGVYGPDELICEECTDESRGWPACEDDEDEEDEL